MSAFDRKVLEWLNTADLPDKSKQTVLARTQSGIATYKQMFTNEPKFAEQVKVDFGLADVVARAQRRLQAGETPLVILPSPTIPTIALRPSASRSSSRPVSARPGTGRSGTGTSPSSPPTQRAVRPATASARAAMVSKPEPMRRRFSGSASKSASASPTAMAHA